MATVHKLLVACLQAVGSLTGNTRAARAVCVSRVWGMQGNEESQRMPSGVLAVHSAGPAMPVQALIQGPVLPSISVPPGMSCAWPRRQ